MAKFTWKKAPSQAWNAGYYKAVLMDAVERKLNYFAPQIEADMKQKASWTDQSANARQTLAAFVHRTPDMVILYAKQHMWYGIFLELKNGGRYAIVMPTLQLYYGPVWKGVKEVVS